MQSGTERHIKQDVRVSFQYPVSFTSDLFHPDNSVLRDTVALGHERAWASKLFAVIDGGVAKHRPDLGAQIESYCRRFPDALQLVSPPLVVVGGEGVKNDPAYVAAVHDAINEFRIDRHSYVIAVGGGAVLDMVGYATGTAHRGVRLIRVPTTVLSQNDSGIGVKNSVNAYGKKNFLGTFAPPFAVLNDATFLTTLDDRDWRSGISEAIKVALLKDPEFFGFIEQHATALVSRDMPTMEWLVYRCAELHLEHIATSGDPFEMGSSRPLDFGHWSAHKLEQLSGYALRHGEAVSIGLALDSTYAHRVGMLSAREWQRVINVLLALDLPIFTSELEQHLNAPNDSRSVLSGLAEFREHLGGELTIMLLNGIGSGIEVHEMDLEHVRASVDILKRYG
jgi:3-dehydroquinate synthase